MSAKTFIITISFLVNARPSNSFFRFILVDSRSLFSGFKNSLSFCSRLTDDQPIIIVEDPRNRSIVVGSDVTLDCITVGYPRLKIKWLRNDNSNAVESNSRASIVQVSINNQTIHHQLVITAVRKEDDGKYQCVAENSAGANTSKEAFINVRDQGQDINNNGKNESDNNS